jgi:hypothetical protein
MTVGRSRGTERFFGSGARELVGLLNNAATPRGTALEDEFLRGQCGKLSICDPMGRASRRHPTRRELLGRARSSYRWRRLAFSPGRPGLNLAEKTPVKHPLGVPGGPATRPLGVLLAIRARKL